MTTTISLLDQTHLVEEFDQPIFACSPSDAGYTLVEMLVAMAIGALTITLVLATLPLFLRVSNDGIAMGHANGNVDITLDQIGRQITSANLVFNPDTASTNTDAGVGSGFSFRMYTLIDGQTKCVQWRVFDGRLESRTWAWQSPGTASGWASFVTSLTNAAEHPPFALDDSTTTYGDRLLDVHLFLKASASSGDDNVTQFTSSYVATDVESTHPLHRPHSA